MKVMKSLSIVSVALIASLGASASDINRYNIKYLVTSKSGTVEASQADWVPGEARRKKASATIDGKKVPIKFSMSSAGTANNLSFALYITQEDRVWGVWSSPSCGNVRISQPWSGEDIMIERKFSLDCELTLTISKE
ncbi:hypothetical protein DEU29_11536 [Idiomarina aquatica]|uniref:Uncharacterized protein n=1 Tax=Idiomarina aquatica TaxID=1327752 RepID=A0A4R6P1C7_9GAMM|nr:hypothetical protein [Idiomarina aquatica]TDP30753.1 hypothetical protein DEU29_11536 [Idiomarina aquatica]